MRSIAVIGGGAAGLAAAIACAHELSSQQMRARVTVYESASRVGASILATGNGRCNISNAHIDPQLYHNSAFVSQVYAAVPPEAVWRFFSELGLVCFDGGEGRLYPITNKANSVLDVLRFELADKGVRVECEKRLSALEEVDGGYRLRFSGGSEVRGAGVGGFGVKDSGAGGRGIGDHGVDGHGAGDSGAKGAEADGSVVQADAVILACGGTALFQGAAGEEIKLPVALRSALQPLRAVLGPLRTDTAAIKGLNNIRVRARITLCPKGVSGVLDKPACDGRANAQAEASAGAAVAGRVEPEAETGCAAEADCLVGEARAVEAGRLVEEGELLFRDYGVSGIAIFNLSRFAQPGDLLLIDLLPHIDKEALRADLLRRVQARHARSAVEQLAGLLLAPVARALCKLEGISPDQPLSAEGAQRLANAAKALRLTVKGIGDARQCQVHRGGIAVDAIDPSMMGLVDHPSLFAAGEVLDVDGPCGGYNLHWAWASGLAAGRAAAQAVASCTTVTQVAASHGAATAVDDAVADCVATDTAAGSGAVSHADTAAQQMSQLSGITTSHEGDPHD